MKKILLLSDTHYYNEIFSLFDTNKYDYCVHCGDSSLSANSHYLKDYIVVEGNHDEIDMFPKYIIKEVADHRIFITHGHFFDIYFGYDKLYEEMKKNNCDICFHGHTHVPSYIHYKNKIFINPGSTMMNRGEIGTGTYAIVTLDKKELSIEYYDDHGQHIPMSVIEKNAKILDEFKEILKK